VTRGRFSPPPEFVAGVVADWAKDRHITLVFAEPGCPWQNGWVESFNVETARRTTQRRTRHQTLEDSHVSWHRKRDPVSSVSVAPLCRSTSTIVTVESC